MEVVNPIKDGEIVDWDAFEGMLDNVFNNQLKCNIKEHPVMFSDEVWSTSKQRERITEINKPNV